MIDGGQVAKEINMKYIVPILNVTLERSRVWLTGVKL